eukprot:2297562-Pleurochrysis_carterae.AAC.1
MRPTEMSSRSENDAEHIGTGAWPERARRKKGERDQNNVVPSACDEERRSSAAVESRMGRIRQGRPRAAMVRTQADGEATVKATT